MSSSLSPIVVDIVLQDLENKALASLKFIPPFYLRYVDDLILAIPPFLLNHTLDTFNSFYSRLQFTMEIGGDRINFLDITLISNNNYIIFDWYHKDTFSGRYLHFLSQHPLCQKKRHNNWLN